MEVKRGENVIKVPGWVMAVGAGIIGGIVADICKTVSSKR